MNLILNNILNNFASVQLEGGSKSRNEIAENFGDILGLLLIQLFASAERSEASLHLINEKSAESGGDSCIQVVELKQAVSCASEFKELTQTETQNHQAKQIADFKIAKIVQLTVEQNKISQVSELVNRRDDSGNHNVVEMSDSKTQKAGNSALNYQGNGQINCAYESVPLIKFDITKLRKVKINSQNVDEKSKCNFQVTGSMGSEQVMMFEKEIFEDRLDKGLSFEFKISEEKFTPKLMRHQSQGENVKDNEGISATMESRVSAVYKSEQMNNNFEFRRNFKGNYLEDSKFERMLEKINTRNFVDVDIKDLDERIGVERPVFHIKAQDIPEFVKSFILKSKDLERGEVVLKVKPKEIGEIVVKISQGESGIRILFEVKNYETKQMIESRFDSLRATLESSNVKPEKIDVLLVAENFDSNYNFSNSEREQFLRKATSKRKVFDSFETVKIYGGSLIEAII